MSGLGLSGSKNSAWKGGRTLASNGYYLVKRIGHPMADCRGYVYEHRLVAAEHLGRMLDRSELVHHKNEIKTDNRWENLEVLSPHQHRAQHRKSNRRVRNPGEANPTVSCACGCGQTFHRFDFSGRPRRFVTGHNTAVQRGRKGEA